MLSPSPLVDKGLTATIIILVLEKQQPLILDIHILCCQKFYITLYQSMIQDGLPIPCIDSDQYIYIYIYVSRMTNSLLRVVIHNDQLP